MYSRVYSGDSGENISQVRYGSPSTSLLLPAVNTVMTGWDIVREMMFDSEYFYSSPPSDISSDVTEPELRACQSEVPDWRVEREDCRGSSQQLSQCSSKPQGTSLTRKLRNGLFGKREKSYKGDRWGNVPQMIILYAFFRVSCKPKRGLSEGTRKQANSR